MDKVAATWERRSDRWGVAYTLAKRLIATNALLLGLYLFTSLEGPFRVVFGTSPASVWYCVGLELALAVMLAIAYHRFHGCADLATRARFGDARLRGRQRLRD